MVMLVAVAPPIWRNWAAIRLAFAFYHLYRTNGTGIVTTGMCMSARNGRWIQVDERYLKPDGSRADSDEKKNIVCSEPLDDCVIDEN